jgi:hypothetical protein
MTEKRIPFNERDLRRPVDQRSAKVVMLVCSGGPAGERRLVDQQWSAEEGADRGKKI